MDNQIDSDLREIITHGTIDFPFVIYRKHFDGNNLSYISCHWHNEIEILFCDEGKVSYTTSNQTYILDENNFIVVNQNMLHQADMIGNAKWYAILFDPKMIYGFNESRIKDLMSNIKFSHILLEDKYLIKKIRSLINLYYNTKTTLYELKVKLALIELYTEILTLILNIIPQDTKPNTNQIKIHQMLEYIYKNYKNKFSIDDVADYAGLCRSDACKYFKEALKTSIADYTLRLRIEKSINLLTSFNLSIAEIANQTGFNSASYYAEAFKKVIGMTPLEYKKKNIA